MTTRPFMNKGIDALEQLFQDAANQIALLKLLADELEYRTVPRAVALRRKVKVAIARHPNGGIEPPPDDELLLTPPARSDEVIVDDDIDLEELARKIHGGLADVA